VFLHPNIDFSYNITLVEKAEKYSAAILKLSRKSFTYMFKAKSVHSL